MIVGRAWACHYKPAGRWGCASWSCCVMVRKRNRPDLNFRWNVELDLQRNLDDFHRHVLATHAAESRLICLCSGCQKIDIETEEGQWEFVKRVCNNEDWKHASTPSKHWKRKTPRAGHDRWLSPTRVHKRVQDYYASRPNARWPTPSTPNPRRPTRRVEGDGTAPQGAIHSPPAAGVVGPSNALAGNGIDRTGGPLRETPGVPHIYSLLRVCVSHACLYCPYRGPCSSQLCA